MQMIGIVYDATTDTIIFTVIDLKGRVMKKLYISCPMRGRTPENIKKNLEQLHKIAEILVGEELEVIDTYLPESDYKDKPIKCLGECIKRMQDADFFIAPFDTYRARGCCIEESVAMSYGINILSMNIDTISPDLISIYLEEEREQYKRTTEDIRAEEIF